MTRAKKKASELRCGDLWAPMGCKAFVVMDVAKGRHTYKGYMRVQYAQPEVPGGIAQQFVPASEYVTVEE